MIPIKLYDKVKDDLERHEGLRLFPYFDTVGKLSIGIGHNLDDKGITREQAYLLFHNDVEDALAEMERDLTPVYDWHKAPVCVQRALINMTFQLGVGGLLKFKRMLAALNRGHWGTAYDEALDSLWAKQTPNRAREVANWILAAGRTDMECGV